MDDALVLAQAACVDLQAVLILVVMDDALVPYSKCYRGISDCIVLILVVMDDALVLT